MNTENAFSFLNRRLHYYLGLYFLFFVWFFALTGLLLNHGAWLAAQMGRNRAVSSVVHPIVTPAPGSPLARARDLMRQLGLAGEIQWVTVPRDLTRLDFRVGRPGVNFEIKSDLNAGHATVQRTDVNAWGGFRVLHTFTGVRLNDPNNERDWIVTTLWALSMDALAAGLALMVLSGVVLWAAAARKRTWGLVALASGCAACGWFVVGLRWWLS